MSQAPPSNLPQRQVLLSALKRTWFEQEEVARQKLVPQKPMTTAPAPWQKWLVHPRGSRPLVDGESPTLEEDYVKVDTAALGDTLFGDPRLLQAVRFNPCLIVASERLLAQRRALVCRIHKGRRHEPSAVRIDGELRCRTDRLRGVSADITTSLDERELLTFEGELYDDYRQDVVDTVTELLKGKWLDSDAPAPGRIVRCSFSGSSFDAFVLTSCRVWDDSNMQDANPVVVCQIIPYRADHEGREADGIVILRADASCNYKELPSTVALPLVRAVPRAYVEEICDASGYLDRVREIMSELVATP